MNPDETVYSAADARHMTIKHEKNKDINYTLTFGRLMKIIEMSAKQGCTELEFEAPSFVLDGCLGDPILLARQLKARLSELGYKVKRSQANLKIDWGGEKK